MAWWSDKLSLGGLQDIAGAVNKISESVKNIEKNFDSALGLEEKRDDAEEGSGSRTSNSDGIGFFNPVMAFMGHNGEESSTEVSEKQPSPKHSPALEENRRVTTEPPTSEADASKVPVTTHSPKQPSELQENVGSSAESPVSKADGSEHSVTPHSPTQSSAAEEKHGGSTEAPASEGSTSEVSETAQSSTYPSVAEETYGGSVETSDLVEKETQGHQDTEYSDPNDEALPSQPGESVRDIPDDRTSSPNKLDQSSVMRMEESLDTGNEVTDDGNTSRSQSADSMVASSDDVNETKVNIVQEVDVQKEIISPPESSDIVDKASHGEVKVHDGETNITENGEENDQTGAHAVFAVENEDNATAKLENLSSKSIIVDNDPDLQNELVPAAVYTPVGPVEVDSHANDLKKEEKIQASVTTTNSLVSVGSVVEVEKLKRDMKMMEAALQGAARQSQSKADEIARLMNENEQLKSTINELKGNKSVEEEMDALKDEYHQRVATLERKVYALTKERDTLRREQNKKSDAAALLKEKDEIITQVMAEGEELSRKQAAQEATIRKLRAQIREFEEEKQRLNSNKSFRGIEKQRSFKFLSMEKQQSFKERRSRDSPGKRGDSALHLAARAGNVSHVQRIFADCDPELVGELPAHQNLDGETALYVAAEKGHVDVVCEILNACDVQSAGLKATNSFDAFHIAAKQGHLDVLQELLQTFPSLAMTTSSVNATALDTAATQGHIGIVNLLLDTDASLARIARSNGKTVLHSAARMGHVEVVAALLNKDPDIGFRTDRKGQTALHMASKGQNAEILLELLKPNVSVIHLEDNKGNRALHVATRKGNTVMVQTLISVEEIDINAVNKAGETAFAIAEKQGNEELVNILREVGGVTAKEQVNPPKSAKQLKQTVSDIKHDVESQIKQTRQTKMHVHKIKKRIQKLHIGGLNNAINSNTVVAVLIATVAFASIFTIPGNFLEDMDKATEPHMSLGQALVASRPAFIIFLVFDSLALFISLAVVVVQTSLIVVEQKAKQKMVFVMNKLMWLACLCISAAFIALTYVVVGRNDEWLAWCTMAIGTVIMLTTIGSMCYCIISHRMEAQSMRRIRRSSMSQSWSISVDSDTELDMTSRNKTMYAL